jgi:hypothetical protein
VLTRQAVPLPVADVRYVSLRAAVDPDRHPQEARGPPDPVAPARRQPPGDPRPVLEGATQSPMSPGAVDVYHATM